MNIRGAKLSDAEWLLTQLKAFSDFRGTRKELFPLGDYASDFIVSMIQNHLVLVAEDEVGPCGFVAGYITPHSFNPSIRTLCEMFYWVEPSHRGSLAAKQLIEEFVKWGKKNVDWITFSVIDGKTRLNERSLYRMGFGNKESTYLMEV